MNTANLGLDVEAFLAAHHVVSLATTDDDGGPHAACVMYALDGLRLYWMSDPESRHSRYIGARPRVTATVAPDYSDFREIRGLQLFGRARRIAGGAELGQARQRMVERYAFLAELAGGQPALRAAFDKAGFYCLEPHRITLIDNTRGFGHKETLEVEGAQLWNGEDKCK